MIVAVVVFAFFAGFGMGMIYGYLRLWRHVDRPRLGPPSYEERVLHSWRCQEEAMVRAARELLPQGPSSRKHPIAVSPPLLRQLYALYLEDTGGRHLSVLNYSIEDRREGPGKVVAFTVGRFEPNGTVWLRRAMP